jgi:cytochrome c
MRNFKGIFGALLLALGPSVGAAALKGYGEIAGRVRGTQADALAVVHALNLDNRTAYTVYVVDGRYRATTLLPGRYRVTVRPAVGQMNGFEPLSVERTVDADRRATADFALGPVRAIPNYVGGLVYDGDPRYPDARILPYDEVYPPGPGRDILERTCNACHAVNLIPYDVNRSYSGGRNPKDRNAWAATVDAMHKRPAFGRPGKAPMFDPALLQPGDREILIDYLAKNFGEKSEPRVVRLDRVPKLDTVALAKAQFVEYSWLEPKGKYEVWPWPHQVDFDPDGNVWLAYTSCCIVRFDPRTAQSKVFEGNGGGHGIAVDQSDGTVWYSGDAVRRLDPGTGLVDRYKVGDDAALGSNTQIFDSKGNLWLSFLGSGGLGKWDRARDEIIWWDVPVVASRPYGIIVDNLDKVWWADYHNGGVSRFDPETGRFRFYRLVREHAASSIRRLGVDSKNHIWAGTWSSLRGVAKLYRLDPETDEVMERTLTDLPYAAIYNAEADSKDNIWLSNDNYLTVYDPRADRFTHFPIPVRSDTLKTTITRDDTVWFFYRNAGKYANYGANAVAFFRDKDRIESLAAYHSTRSVHNRMHAFRGPAAPKVQGIVKASPAPSQNAAAYAAWARDNRLAPAAPPGPTSAGAAAPAASRASPGTGGSAAPIAVNPATVAAGERVFATACATCHTLERGAPHGVGPNLWGVLGARAGARADFAYSAALEGSGLVWSAQTLAAYAAAPQSVVPGTLMASVGVSSEPDRRALLAFIAARASGAAREPGPSAGANGDAAVLRE